MMKQYYQSFLFFGFMLVGLMGHSQPFVKTVNSASYTVKLSKDSVVTLSASTIECHVKPVYDSCRISLYFTTEFELVNETEQTLFCNGTLTYYSDSKLYQYHYLRENIIQIEPGEKAMIRVLVYNDYRVNLKSTSSYIIIAGDKSTVFPFKLQADYQYEKVECPEVETKGIQN